MFGGAFDPPHNAHVALARAAIGQLALDELRIVPTGQAWHKARELSAAEHRLAMTRLALQGLPGAVVDERELRRAGASYTIDTLAEFAAEQPGAALFLLLGADQARLLPRWHRWQEILSLATIVVAEREDTTGATAAFDWENAAGARHSTLRLAPMSESATAVRALARTPGVTPTELARMVPAPVARYIARHHLYQPAR
ncbi:MAG: Nicotinate-nucleotide adenylyltransferase [Burkholderiaceae bacterium]|jgi:nicotinate-nucleotide adenylyltransferase|nr:MAG: Nicotinate-nucleotide adenylyltransferase [Burkholderiaceae bacterium]